MKTDNRTKNITMGGNPTEGGREHGRVDECCRGEHKQGKGEARA